MDITMVKTRAQIPGRIYTRIQHGATGATHRFVGCVIASTIARPVKRTTIGSILCGIDGIATRALDGRMPVRMLFSVVSSIAHGTTEGMREGELGHFRYQIEDWCLGKTNASARRIVVSIHTPVPFRMSQ